MFAYGYCRYSSSNQNELSIEQQHIELLNYAKNHNIEIIKFYDDKAKSNLKKYKLKQNKIKSHQHNIRLKKYIC